MKILISGSGIAGTTLAYWLHRHGFTPTVVERAASVRDGGYKIDIRGSALQVVERMGLLPRIRALSTDVRAGHIVDAAGRKVAGMDGDTFGGRTHDDAEIQRGDLNGLLHDQTKGQVEYLFGDSIAAIDGTAVTFHSGLTRQFDLVIGADGLHSSTRALAFGPEGDFVHDMGYYVAVYSVPNHLGLDREELTYVSPGRTALMYSTARDSGAKAMFLFASPPLDHDGRDQAGRRALLADAFAGEGWEVPTLLAGMAEAPDFYFDRLSQVHLGRWSKGRVALVGDAAYAASTASGQGTSLALVGAYVLAAELARHDGHDEAFTAYERRMRPFAEANQKLGPANIKGMVLRGRSQVWMSMKMLSLLSRMPRTKERMMARVVTPIHHAANAITLD